MASGTRRPSGQLASRLTVTGIRIFLEALATRLPPLNRRRGSLSLPRPPIGDSGQTWYGNINPLAIDYAFRPRLRSRLTLGGFTFPRKPWVFGERDSHPSNRYSSRHIHFLALHDPFRNRFAAARNALLPLLSKSTASAPRLFPIIIGARVLDQ